MHTRIVLGVITAAAVAVAGPALAQDMMNDDESVSSSRSSFDWSDPMYVSSGRSTSSSSDRSSLSSSGRSGSSEDADDMLNTSEEANTEDTMSSDEDARMMLDTLMRRIDALERRIDARGNIVFTTSLRAQNQGQEGPEAVGTGFFRYENDVLHYDITVSGLSSPVTIAHVVTDDGRVVHDIMFEGDHAEGSWNIGEDQDVRGMLMNGGLTLYVVTEQRPEGELVGRLTLMSGDRAMTENVGG